jgi:N-acetylmuramoyl-L-alanine amidase
MRAGRKIILASAVGVFLAAGAGLFFLVPVAAGQDAPQTVDDVINRVLRERAQPQPKAPPPIAVPQAQPQSIPALVNPPQTKEALVMGARIGEHADRTRFVIELSEPIEMRTFTLNNPNRVVIDMPSVRWHLDGPPKPSGVGAVRSYRYGTFRPGNARFVIDLNGPVNVGEPMVLPPENGSGYRVVFDLFPIAQAKFDRQAGWPEDLKAREQAVQMAALPKTPPVPQTRIKKVIVIDAGHGGPDSGTIGHDGTMEKDVVLATALKLRSTLLARGYTVHMTRETDMIVPLPQRARIARAYKADLFISIHADSNPDTNVSGLSIYTLSEKGSDREAAALAQKENAADAINGVDLSGDNSAVAPILIDLAQRDTMNKSSRFAEAALAQLSAVTDILPRQPHRSAGFVVLKSPDMPSVLVELGYLSNDHDAPQMQLDSWRARVARAIAGAVDKQFMTQTEAGAGSASNPP